MEDYDKGLMTPDLIRGVLARCEEARIPVAVDPKLRRFADYKNVTLFKPNLKELNEGLTLETPADPTNRDSMIHAVDTLMSTLGCACAFVTLGEHGAWIHAPSRGVEHVHLNALNRERGGRQWRWRHGHRNRSADACGWRGRRIHRRCGEPRWRLGL